MTKLIPKILRCRVRRENRKQGFWKRGVKHTTALLLAITVTLPVAKAPSDPVRPAEPPIQTVAASPDKLILYVPDEDGWLYRQEWDVEYSTPPADATHEATRAWRAEQALMLLLTHYPTTFPAGTHLIAFQDADEGSVFGCAVRWDQNQRLATVNLSREFIQPDFWQGSTRTLLGIYAIVNSAAANVVEDEGSVAVQILIEGKPVEVIGEFYAREPIEADFTYVAPE